MIFLFNWVIFRFRPSIFRGESVLVSFQAGWEVEGAAMNLMHIPNCHHTWELGSQKQQFVYVWCVDSMICSLLICLASDISSADLQDFMLDPNDRFNARNESNDWWVDVWREFRQNFEPVEQTGSEYPTIYGRC